MIVRSDGRNGATHAYLHHAHLAYGTPGCRDAVGGRAVPAHSLIGCGLSRSASSDRAAAPPRTHPTSRTTDFTPSTSQDGDPSPETCAHTATSIRASAAHHPSAAGVPLVTHSDGHPSRV